MANPHTGAHSAVAHHFQDYDQQRDAVSLGMWTFLTTEVLFFGGLFAGYMVFRAAYPQAFIEGSHHLDVVLGAINTWVLLTSSLTMALAVHAAQLGRAQRTTLLLVATLVLGLVFLGIKGLEYYHKFEEGLIPGASFVWPGADRGPVQLFFFLYFTMTGLHAIHMIIGIGVIIVMAWLAWRGYYQTDYMPVEVLGLYWHFVDIVWIFLFPLLYLISR
ncbi:MAG: cytochrome oxidase subunit III [Chloroflexi bacterium]|nr:MAG: cytochrome oxidase subunit III [Chloroflexota bacterium]